MGTCRPCQGVDWLGVYLTNDGQKVMANDAHLLAGALEKSLSNISDANPRLEWNPNSWIENDFPEWLSPDTHCRFDERSEEKPLSRTKRFLAMRLEMT